MDFNNPETGDVVTLEREDLNPEAMVYWDDIKEMQLGVVQLKIALMKMDNNISMMASRLLAAQNPAEEAEVVEDDAE